MPKSGRSSSRGRGSSPSPPNRSSSSSSTTQRTHSSQGPGLMGQMAATAGGVAIGSVIGNSISGAMHGSQSSEGRDEGSYYQNEPPPCQLEMRQLLECVLTAGDLRACQELKEAVKRCQRENNLA